MKKAIHPDYFPQATISCACGSSFTVGSTEETISVELCSKCHPYYTGEQKIIDTARRVEKFKARAAAAADDTTGKKARAAKRARLKEEKAKKQLEPEA